MPPAPRSDDQPAKASADSEDPSRQGVLRREAVERYERSGHAARVQESSARLTGRWGDVLNRLGRA